jgi:folylpolyglutamate synthase
MSEQKSFSAIWKKLQPASKVISAPTVTLALDAARDIGKMNSGMQTLITGSQHLVGETLFVLKRAVLS